MQSTGDKRIIPKDDLGERIRRIPYDTPGPDLARRIMAEVSRKKNQQIPTACAAGAVTNDRVDVAHAGGRTGAAHFCHGGARL